MSGFGGLRTKYAHIEVFSVWTATDTARRRHFLDRGCVHFRCLVVSQRTSCCHDQQKIEDDREDIQDTRGILPRCTGPGQLSRAGRSVASRVLLTASLPLLNPIRVFRVFASINFGIIVRDLFPRVWIRPRAPYRDRLVLAAFGQDFLGLSFPGHSGLHLHLQNGIASSALCSDELICTCLRQSLASTRDNE